MTDFWKHRKVLITGASGFVGSNAVDYFLNLGASISASISPKIPNVLLKKRLGENRKKVKILTCNLLNPKEAAKTTTKVDTILNFAAVDGGLDFKLQHSAEVFSKNIRITLNMLEAAVKSGVKSFLLVSTSDLYNPNKTTPITEKDSITLYQNENVDGYKLAKWTSELAAKEFARQYELNTVIVRPSNLYGPRDNFEDLTRIRFIPSAIRNVFLENNPIVIWGKGNQIRSYLYVDDFLSICRQLIEKDIINDPINIASKRYISLKVLARKIISMSGKNIQIKIDPTKPPGAKIRKFDLSLLESKIKKNKELDLDKGLERTINYFKETLPR